jgi:hypothetical protein
VLVALGCCHLGLDSEARRTLGGIGGRWWRWAAPAKLTCDWQRRGLKEVSGHEIGTLVNVDEL